jgi:hypothetical protein
MMASKSFVFSFDDVEVREREFKLIKAGKVLTVEPKAFRALLFLLHNPQRLISKEERLDAVWDDAAVTEGSPAALHRHRGYGRIPVRVQGRQGAFLLISALPRNSVGGVHKNDHRNADVQNHARQPLTVS